MEWIDIVNMVIGLLFTVCYCYQFFYIIVSCICKPKKFPGVPEPKNRYAIMISARNEENVIGFLLDSIKKQTYPEALTDVFVVADNCDDETAKVAAEHGATEVFSRFNKEQVGKGYALEYLFDAVREKYGHDTYTGYFIIDADNLLDPDFVLEMDKCVSDGNRIITCYRNSKNYGDNWISSGYALWFLHEARQLNHVRHLLGSSCAVSGTGFFVHHDIIERQGGWKHFLLTEDIEFTIDNVLQGEKVAYCHKAVVFDEQPNTFGQSWRQRMRWSKGFLQVIRSYGAKLLKNIVTFRGFSFYDMFMTIAPAFFLTLVSVGCNLAALLLDTVTLSSPIRVAIGVGSTLFGAYGLLFVIGLLTMLCEGKHIHATLFRKIWSLFTFPFFMMTYIPIAVCALFAKGTWKPIKHKICVSTDELMQK